MTAPGEVMRLDSGPSVLLTGAALLEVAWLAGLGLEELRRRHSVAPWPRLVELQRALASAAAAERDRTLRTRPQAGIGQIGHPDNGGPALCAPSAGWLTTREVAQVLRISQRQAQRLGPQLGVRHGRAYRFDSQAVAAYSERGAA